MTRVGHAGLGDWGKNLVRNFDELAELAWLCDLDEERRAEFAARYPQRVDGDVRRGARRRLGRGRRRRDAGADALRAREAGARGRQARLRREAARDEGAEMEELVALARDRDLVLMPGHLLLYHPGVRKLKELVDDGELGDVAVRLRQPPEPRRDPLERERAVVARRARPLGDPLAARRGADRGGRARHRLPAARRRGRRLLLPPLPVGPDRAHAPLVARPAQDAEDDRGRPREDGRLRRHGARAQGHRSTRRRRGSPRETYGEWRTRTGDIFSPKIPNDEPLRLECEHFLELVEEGPATTARRSTGSPSCARSTG